MSIDNTQYELGDHANAMRFVVVVALFGFLFALAAALPGRTSHPDAMRGVSEACDSPSCVSTRQFISAKEARRMKRELADHALLVDIRASAEAPARPGPDSDAHVPFMEPGTSAMGNGATSARMDFRIDFGQNVDQALRAAHMRHDDPVILMSPSAERAVLAALLLQERGYSRILVMRD